MRNIHLSRATAADIERQVQKVLRGLGDPEPPLRLEDVRELLRLDRGYYSSRDDGFLREMISRMTVAGAQVLERPALLLDVVRKFDLRALYLPDRKRILLDASQPEPKQRWNEAHEIGHSLLPWHADLMLGDHEQSLTPACHAQIEAEANYAAGQLLFLQSRFLTAANDTGPTLSAVRALKAEFGNTYTTTFWRYIESAQPPAGLPAPFAEHIEDEPAVGVGEDLHHPRLRERRQHLAAQRMAESLELAFGDDRMRRHLIRPAGSCAPRGLAKSPAAPVPARAPGGRGPTSRSR